jgi:hypothetical protein
MRPFCMKEGATCLSTRIAGDTHIAQRFTHTPRTVRGFGPACSRVGVSHRWDDARAKTLRARLPAGADWVEEVGVRGEGIVWLDGSSARAGSFGSPVPVQRRAARRRADAAAAAAAGAEQFAPSNQLLCALTNVPPAHSCSRDCRRRVTMQASAHAYGRVVLSPSVGPTWP